MPTRGASLLSVYAVRIICSVRFVRVLFVCVARAPAQANVHVSSLIDSPELLSTSMPLCAWDGMVYYWTVYGRTDPNLPQHACDLLARHGSEARRKVLELDCEVTTLVTLACARSHAGGPFRSGATD